MCTAMLRLFAAASGQPFGRDAESVRCFSRGSRGAARGGMSAPMAFPMGMPPGYPGAPPFAMPGAMPAGLPPGGWQMAPGIPVAWQMAPRPPPPPPQPHPAAPRPMLGVPAGMPGAVAMPAMAPPAAAADAGAAAAGGAAAPHDPKFGGKWSNEEVGSSWRQRRRVGSLRDALEHVRALARRVPAAGRSAAPRRRPARRQELEGSRRGPAGAHRHAVPSPVAEGSEARARQGPVDRASERGDGPPPPMPAAACRNGPTAQLMRGGGGGSSSTCGVACSCCQWTMADQAAATQQPQPRARRHPAAKRDACMRTALHRHWHRICLHA